MICPMINCPKIVLSWLQVEVYRPKIQLQSEVLLLTSLELLQFIAAEYMAPLLQLSPPKCSELILNISSASVDAFQHWKHI